MVEGQRALAVPELQVVEPSTRITVCSETPTKDLIVQRYKKK